MEIDWFQATIMEPADRLLQWADAAYSDCERNDLRGHNVYEHRREYVREGILQLCVYHGGPNVFPNVKATSNSSPRFASVVRRDFPARGQIRVTRIDACQDFEGPGAFDLAHAAMQSVCLGRGIKTQHAGDWDRKVDGRSYYAGSKSSAFRSVLYEKGIEMRPQIAASGGPARPNLCRLEGRFRPQTVEAKVAASTLTAGQVFGCCRWGPPLLRAVLSVDVERIKMTEYRAPDFVMSRFAMAKQYFNTLSNWIADCDHDEAKFGAAIMETFDTVQRRMMRDDADRNV